MGAVAVPGADVVPGAGALLVVGGRLHREPGSGGICPSSESVFVHGTTQTTVRTPEPRIRRTIASKSGNWWGFGIQVLYCVSQGESRTTASSGMSCQPQPVKSSSTSSWWS